MQSRGANTFSYQGPESSSLPLQVDGLTLRYEPQVDFNSGQLLGVEALLRSTAQGTWSAQAMIQDMEASGRIVLMGNRILHQALCALSRWRRAHGFLGWVSVNVSPLQIEQSDWAATVCRHLDELRVPADCLHIEITETAVLHATPHVRAQLSDLRAKGVSIYLDDFAVGYSSMAYLRWMPVDGIKLDRMFCQGIDRDFTCREITRALQAMADALGLRTIAEGVETLEAVDTLQRIGCRVGQGWHYAKAAHESAVDMWIRDGFATGIPSMKAPAVA